MRRRRVQILFLACVLYFFTSQLPAEPIVGQIYQFNMVDVDGNKSSDTDHRVTTVVIASSTDTDKAREVGDRTPEHCLGNPEFRMITLLQFEKKHLAATKALMKAVIRRRLATEAAKLQERYRAHNISRDARHDVICIADFDGSAVAQLGVPAGSTKFQVLVFGRNGELLRQWDSIPTKEELAEILK